MRLKTRRIFVYYLLVTVSCLFLGCGSRSYSTILVEPTIRSADTIDINSFCKRHNFKYDFDTLDDIVRVFSSDKEIKLILNSVVGSFNG
ncbi:MAG: hypothetical protein JSV34_06815, partial [Candidatus Omnitrophota bacterium]